MLRVPHILLGKRSDLAEAVPAVEEISVIFRDPVENQVLPRPRKAFNVAPYNENIRVVVKSVSPERLPEIMLRKVLEKRRDEYHRTASQSQRCRSVVPAKFGDGIAAGVGLADCCGQAGDGQALIFFPDVSDVAVFQQAAHVFFLCIHKNLIP